MILPGGGGFEKELLISIAARHSAKSQMNDTWMIWPVRTIPVHYANPWRMSVVRSLTTVAARAQSLPPEDARLPNAIHQGQFCLLGFRNRDLKQKLFGQKAQASNTKLGKRQSAQVTRHIRLLRSHYLIKQVQATHRYILSEKGRLAVTTIAAAPNASPKRLAELAVLNLHALRKS